MAEPQTLAGGPEIARRTIRRWRRAFLGIYLTVTVGAGLLALLSMLSVHLGVRELIPVAAGGPVIRATANEPKELRACHRELERLLLSLHEETFVMQGRALKYKIDPAAEWHNWSNAWRGRWQTVQRRCRLRELGGAGVSKEIDRMAAIHDGLGELQLSYTGVMDRFLERYVDRLRRLRADLTAVRDMIDHRSAGAGRPSGTR